MKKIAFINQRYGLEVNGGSEYYTRLMAEHLRGTYEIEILTTKAVDHVTWANYYKCDEEEINGIKVRRFPVTEERNMERFGPLNARMMATRRHKEEDELAWIHAQGPVCPDLIRYIRDHQDEYDVFVFVTYLYYTTCVGILEVPQKAVLIPTAHDEPCIYFDYYKKVFNAPKAIIFLTEEERAFVQKKFRNQQIRNDVMAVSIDVPADVSAERFLEARKVKNYITYVGRIEEAKGCAVLFQYFLEYKKRNPNDLKLVLMGKAAMGIPQHEDIISLGFVSEQEKFDGIQGAKALILPSSFESLSISVLEAMTLGVPVIVNGKCEVLKGHCVRSNAGFYYNTYFEFEGELNYLLSHRPEAEKMGKNGMEYIERDYTWEKIIPRFERIIDSVQAEENHGQ